MPAGEDAIEDLYQLFTYELPTRLDYCRYCDDAGYEAALHGPLGELAPELVAKYVSDAIHHTGDEQDFKHFVPRVLELASVNRLPLVDLELVLGRLSDAGWYRWPVREQVAVTRVLAAMWESTLASHPATPGADELLCGLGRAYGDLDPLLTAWAHDSRLTAGLHLRDLILDNANELPAGRLGDPWWTDAPDTMASVVSWLRSREVQEALLAALDDVDEEQAALFDRALTLIS